MRADGITGAFVKRLIESFLHNGWTNISVVMLSSSELGAVKCCKGKWNDVAMGLDEPGCERETVNEKTGRPLRAARG